MTADATKTTPGPPPYSSDYPNTRDRTLHTRAHTRKIRVNATNNHQNKGHQTMRANEAITAISRGEDWAACYHMPDNDNHRTHIATWAVIENKTTHATRLVGMVSTTDGELVPADELQYFHGYVKATGGEWYPDAAWFIP